VRTARHRPVTGPVSAPARVISWARQHLILAAGLPVLIAAGAVSVIVLVSGGGQTDPPTPAATATPAEAAVTGGAKWVTGPASKLIARVDTDLGRLVRAERAGQHRAAEGAGAQLAADAKAALAGPMPPARARTFRSALRELERAGAQAASGQFSLSGRLLAAGTTGLTKVTAAADVPAPVNPPAAVTGPNG
jgi:hypothetical protein